MEGRQAPRYRFRPLEGGSPMRTSTCLAVAVVTALALAPAADKLRAVLVEGGGEKLLDALQDVKPRAGYISTSTSLGWDLQFARQIPYGDGARRIILATDRPMSFFELRNQPRSRDYEFLLVEIRLNKNGVGEGKLAGAAKVSYDADTRVMEIENYGIEPVRLTKVEVVGK
jgi:hypothetical protein